MKFGIVSDEIDRDFASAVRIGKAAGLERYEIRGLKSGRIPMCSQEEVREVERIASGEGVEITGISPGLFKMAETEVDFADAMSEVYPRAADLAIAWRVPGLIVFGFHKPGATEENAGRASKAGIPDTLIEWLAAAGERAVADGLLLMIEPEPVCWADTATATVEMIGRARCRNLRINYDPGNVAWFEQRDPIDEFDAAAPWIANVHVKDWLPPARFVPAGEGTIDYRAHFAALKRSGYAGPISLEPHMDGSIETIRRCKEALERCYETDATRGD